MDKVYKFFLFDKETGTVCKQCRQTDAEGQQFFNFETVDTSSLENAAIFTTETVKGFDFPDSVIPLPVTQQFLDEMPWSVIDSDPTKKATDNVVEPFMNEDVILLCPLGLCVVDEECQTYKIKSPDMSEAVPITNQKIYDLKLNESLEEIGTIKVKWNENLTEFLSRVEFAQEMKKLNDLSKLQEENL